MADNLGYTPGAGATVASDDVGSVHYQKIKLDGGGDGATSPITGDTTNGLDVDVTRLPYSTASASRAATGDIFSQDLAGMRYWSVQISGTFSASVRFEGSNDNSNWTDLNWNQVNSTTGPFNGTTGSTGIYTGALNTRYFRVRVASYTSGTVQADAIFTASPSVGTVLSVSSGNPATFKVEPGPPTAHDGLATSINPLLVGGYSSAAAPSDVSGDGDSTRLWLLRNGSQVVNLPPVPAATTGTLGSVVATGSIDLYNTSRISVQVSGTWVGTMKFQYSHDGTTWFDCPLELDAGRALATTVTDDGQNGIYSGPVHGLFFRLNMTAYTSGSLAYSMMKIPSAVPDSSPLGNAHGQVSKAFNATTTQTGIDVWSPTAGKRIAVESVVIGAYGTTAARLILWFGDNADTTYTAGTDQLLLAASFAPSSTSKPGLTFTPASPVFCTTVDRELHVTTDAGMSVDIAVHGFEW